MFSTLRGELGFPSGKLASWRESAIDLSSYALLLECLHPVGASLAPTTVSAVLDELGAIGVEIDRDGDELHIGGDTRRGADHDSYKLAAVIAHAQDYGGEGELFMMDGERDGHGQLFCVFVEVTADGADAETLSDPVAKALLRRLRESGTVTRDMLEQTLRALGLERPSGRAQTQSDV